VKDIIQQHTLDMLTGERGQLSHIYYLWSGTEEYRIEQFFPKFILQTPALEVWPTTIVRLFKSHR